LSDTQRRFLTLKRGPAAMSAVTTATVLGSLLVASAATAQQPSRRNAQVEHRIEQQLEAIAPDVVRAFQQATVAMDKADNAEAARLYRQVLAKAPGFSPALRRLGFSLAGAGSLEEALTYARQAVQTERSPENLISLAQILAMPVRGQQSSAEARGQALTLSKEASALPHDDNDPSYLFFTAQMALSLQMTSDFRTAVDQLAEKFPRQMPTHYFKAILAAFDEDWLLAEAEIHEAQKLGLPDAAMEGFLSSGVRLRANIRRGLGYAVYAVIAWALGLLLLLLIGKILSSRTLQSIEAADPNGLVTPAERSLRSTYRKLIRFGGAYYYISQPVVLVLVIGGTAGVIYAFFMLGQVPVRLVFILGVGALITAYKMLQSLFIRVESVDPGRSLDAAEAPGLWEMTRDVARIVGTSPIDEIRITPGTDLAVYERGTVRERMQGKGRRILILGIGLVDGFGQGPFCAVLAHEYGHFAHGDTAGGDIALRVRQDMMKFAVAMVQHRQNVWWNLAFQFLRVYDFIFRRISHGATRLQEVLADRVAARHFGAKQFEDGLRHAVRRTAEFTFAANNEIRSAIEAGRGLQNLYGQRPPASPELEDEVERELSRPTTEDDTHPGPSDRFRLVSRVVSTGEPTPSGMLWDLFVSRASLTVEMTNQIAARVNAANSPEQAAT
jgi:tetratricopeptide (TPR) repeat protein